MPGMTMAPAPPREIQLAASFAPTIATPRAGAEQEVGERRLGAPRRSHAESPNGTGQQQMAQPMSPLPPPSATAREVLLELSDISFVRAPSSGFAVFLATDADPRGAQVGLIDLFGATHRDVAGMAAMRVVQRFDVTALVRGQSGPFTVRVEPYDLLVSKRGPAAKRDDGIRIGAMRFVAVS
jgi:hypothetical protein